jgi:hypothetical protein
MRFISLIIAAAFAAVPAGAIDLTGTWVGTFNCAEFDGEKHKFSQKGEILLITQVGNALNIDWGGNPIAGIAIDDIKKPDDKGAAALVDCDTTTDPTSGYSELANLKAKVNRPKGKGSLKGTSVYTQDGSATGQCKWSFKLENTADPLVPATCP